MPERGIRKSDDDFSGGTPAKSASKREEFQETSFFLEKRIENIEHQWVKLDGDDAIVGITSFAAKELGDITYVELPREGSDVIVGDSLGIVESVTDSSDIYSPVSGTVIQINHNLDDDPGIINRSPEEKGWICKLENIDLAEFDDLLEEEDYKKYLATL